MYTVKGIAFDAKVEIVEELPVVVGNFPCKMPRVAIIKPKLNIDVAETYFKMYPIVQEANNSIECDVEVNVT